MTCGSRRRIARNARLRRRRSCSGCRGRHPRDGTRAMTGDHTRLGTVPRITPIRHLRNLALIRTMHALGERPRSHGRLYRVEPAVIDVLVLVQGRALRTA